MELQKKSFDYFKSEMKGGEMLYLWWALFENFTYVIDGNPRDKRADCLGAYFFWFEKVGANLIVETIPSMVERNKKMFELKQLKVYKDGKKIYFGGYDNIKPGDVIIFYHPNAKISYHIGICYGKDNNMLQYMEMGGPVFRPNFNVVSFDNPSILMIFSHTLTSWLGDSLSTDGATK
jgi:hypothetical protein